MKFYSIKSTVIPLLKAIGNSGKIQLRFIVISAIMLFSMNVSAQDNTPPTLINPSIGCSSLDFVSATECYNVAFHFNGSSLVSAVAALYQDPSGPVIATLINTNAGPNNSYCSWSFIYTYKIEDSFGNFVTCQVTRSGSDPTFPTFTVPADITIYQNANCSLIDNPDTAITGNVTDAADNCGILEVIYADCEGRRGTATSSGCSFSCSGQKVIERTWRVFDSCGNKAEGIQLITIMDTTRPVFTVFPLDFTTNGGDNVFYTVEAADNCFDPILTYHLSGATVDTGDGSGSGVHFNDGTTLVTITARDQCGNAVHNSFSVAVIDDVPPAIIAPNIFRSYSADNYGCSINLGASATDNTQLDTLYSNAPACFPVGITTVTWTAKDHQGNVSTKTQLVTRFPPDIGITIVAERTRTIYRGTAAGVGPLGPQSINLTASVTGGLAPYTYSWSPTAGLSNPNIANPVADPVSTTTYTLTVTDNFGTHCSLSITINVLPLSAAICTGNGNNAKFNVCHIPPGSPSNPQNICISANALPAHLAGGQGHNNCYLGICSQNTVSTTPGACQPPSNGRGLNPGAGDNHGDFIIQVSPNPSSREFLIQVFSRSREPVTVRIIDNNGALRSVNSSTSGTNYVIVGSSLLSGTYMAEVIQGNNRKVVKLVKLY